MKTYEILIRHRDNDLKRLSDHIARISTSSMIKAKSYAKELASRITWVYEGKNYSGVVADIKQLI